MSNSSKTCFICGGKDNAHKEVKDAHMGICPGFWDKYGTQPPVTNLPTGRLKESWVKTTDDKPQGAKEAKPAVHSHYMKWFSNPAGGGWVRICNCGVVDVPATVEAFHEDSEAPALSDYDYAEQNRKFDLAQSKLSTEEMIQKYGRDYFIKQAKRGDSVSVVSDGLDRTEQPLTEWCYSYPDCGLTQWSCDRLQSIVYEDDEDTRRKLARKIRQDMGEVAQALSSPTSSDRHEEPMPKESKDQDTSVDEILYDHWARHRYCKNGCQVEGENEVTKEAIEQLISQRVVEEKLVLLKNMRTYYTKGKHSLLWFIDQRISELKGGKE